MEGCSNTQSFFDQTGSCKLLIQYKLEDEGNNGLRAAKLIELKDDGTIEEEKDLTINPSVPNTKIAKDMILKNYQGELL